MPKTVKVVLGGREYTLSEKVMGVSQKWREKLRQSRVLLIFSSLDDAVAAILGAVEGGIENITPQQVIPIARLLPLMVTGLTNSIDDVLDLLFDYSPEMEADKEWIMEHSYTSEGIAAFLEVLKLNFPITALWGLIAGPKAQATATNLPSRNGASGTKKGSALQRTR